MFPEFWRTEHERCLRGARHETVKEGVQANKFNLRLPYK